MNGGVVKRMRPLLGTFFSIVVEGDGPKVEETVGRAFIEAARLGRELSKFEAESWPNRFNRWSGSGPLELPDEFFPLFQMAFELFEASQGAFDPFTPEGDMDLTGIAKGWIVDRVSEFLATELPDFETCVNAGGDLRFHNSTHRPVSLSLGEGRFRHIDLPCDSIAVSSLDTENPSTVYHKTSSRARTVAVMHDSCAMADALAKVALFDGGDEVLARYGARRVVVEAR